MEEEDVLKSKKKIRGMTTGKKARNSPGPKHIEFNDKGQPTGLWRPSFATDVGVIARNIRITYKYWTDVPDGQKDTIWLDIKSQWNIDEEHRKKVLSYVGSKFREFRSYLTSYFILKTRKQRRAVPLDNPITYYTMITKEDWDEFVRDRNDPNFKIISDKARASQEHNKHPHFMGRDGYDGKLAKWYKEEFEKEKEANPELDDDEIAKIVRKRLSNRGFTWIKGHTPSSGNPLPETKKMIDEINHWTEKMEGGEFVPSGKEDVLVKATGKPDHPGRVRAVGSYVNQKTYFGKQSRKPREKFLYTADDMVKMKEEWMREAVERMEAVMNDKLSQKKTIEHTIEGSPEQDHSSCHSVHSDHDDPFVDLQAPTPCLLAIDKDGSLDNVAEGMAWPIKAGAMVHNMPLCPENAYVSIDKVIKGDAPLPVPWFGFERVGEVVGSFAQWPKVLVKLGLVEEHVEANNKNKSKSKVPNGSRNERENEDDNLDKRELGLLNGNPKKKVKLTKIKDVNKTVQDQGVIDGPLSAKELTSYGEDCVELENFMVALTSQSASVICITISDSVYNHDTHVDVHLNFEDIRQMFRFKWLTVTMLQVWGSFLYDYATSLDVINDVAYMCPVMLCAYERDSKGMQDHIVKVLKIQQDKKYVMGAFHESNHWMLLVIHSSENMAYIFDSNYQANKKSLVIKAGLKAAWKVYCYVAGKRHPTKKSDLVIKIINCPQQVGSFECGYYVMKWMYDITVHYSTSQRSLEESVLDSSITIEDLDALREYWSQCCLRNT